MKNRELIAAFFKRFLDFIKTLRSASTQGQLLFETLITLIGECSSMIHVNKSDHVLTIESMSVFPLTTPSRYFAISAKNASSLNC